MMHNKKILPFLSLLFFQISLFNGQTKDSCSMYSICQKEIDTVKLNVYKAILNSKELQNNRHCHIVGINTVSLNMKYSPGYEEIFYDIKVIEDSTSIKNLKNFFPKYYQFYSINNKLLNSLENREYIHSLEKLEKQDNTYPLYYFQEDICQNNFDVIKIQEPLDNWMNIYKANILLNKANVIIPVIYESFIDKPKYLLYKIELYEGSTKIKSVKVVELE